MIKATPIKALRLLTGIFEKEEDSMITIIQLCCLIARYLDNDPILRKDFLVKVFKESGIELDLSEEIKNE